MVVVKPFRQLTCPPKKRSAGSASEEGRGATSQVTNLGGDAPSRFENNPVPIHSTA